MITSRGTDKHRSNAEQVGVSAYLTKPYSDGEPLNQVRDLLAALTQVRSDQILDHQPVVLLRHQRAMCARHVGYA